MKISNVSKKKEIFSWAMYDFANSAFATTILAVIFNVYFATVIVGTEGVRILGFNLPGDVLWGYVVSFSMILVCLSSPILGVIADFSRTRKKFLFFYCCLGAIFTGLLFFTQEGDYLSAIIFFVIANLGFSGGNVFYNAFLPEISNEKNVGRISGLGWALGYLGGGLCLLLNLAMIQSPQLFGIPDKNFLPVRISLLSVGFWWILFALPIFFWTKEESKKQTSKCLLSYVSIGFSRLKSTFGKIKNYKHLTRFLISYLIYNDGIQTVIVMAAVFAGKELGMSQGEIIKCFLLIQGVAFLGALLFGYLADKINIKTSLVITLFIWCAVVVWAFFIRSKMEFWILGCIVGLILGGSQSASRSLFSLFVPPENSAEFFSFFAISGKFSSILGPFVYALLGHIFNSSRISILALVVFFIIGLIGLYFVDEEKGFLESKNPLF